MHQPIVEPQDRYTVPDDPGRESSFRGELFFLNGGRSYSQDPHIDERTALTYSAVWACKQFISQTIASLGWHVFERSIDGRSRKPIEDNIAWTLGMQANPEMNSFEWRQLMVNDALNGNGYSEIERTNSGAPNWMWRICPSRVSLLRDEYGRLLYAVSNQGNDYTYLTPDNVFHLRGPSPDGLVGYSVIEMFRRSIGLGVATERYGRTFYDRGPMPGGILKMPPMLKKEARDEARESFERAYGGSVNAGRIMVLTGAMDFTPLSLSNHDAQFILSRTENAYDVCRIYRVPPHKIGLMRDATYCIPGDASVFTETGPKRADAVQVGERVWSRTKDSRWVLSRVEASSCTGEGEVLEIKAGIRTLRCTANHRVPVRRMSLVSCMKGPAVVIDGQKYRKTWEVIWIDAGDIRVGDELLAANGFGATGVRSCQTREECSVEFMEALGMLMGDGFYARTGKHRAKTAFGISHGEDEDYLPHYVAAIESEFVAGDGPYAMKNGGRVALKSKRRDKNTTTFCSTVAYAELDKLGIAGTAKTKRVPAWIFALADDLKLAFLRGYLDADGTINKAGNIRYVSVNRELLEGVRHLCVSVGIRVGNLFSTEVESQFNGKPYHHTLWSIICTGDAGERIGSHSSFCRERTAAKVARKLPRNCKVYPCEQRRFAKQDGVIYTRVLSIRSLGTMPVYDLSVEGTHTFVCDNLLVHNSNIEHQGIEATQDCILPWARRLEMEADIKLYGRVNRGRRYTRLNLATLLRGDTAAQTDAVTRRVAAGLNTINEGREYLDLDPIEGGDVLIVQGAMSTLDRIVNPPEPQPPKQGQGGSGETNGGDNVQKPEEEQDDGSDAMREAFVGLFAEAYGRQLKVEADKARRAESQGQLQSWVESFYGKDLEARVASSILSVVTALVAAVGGGKPERAASLAARLAEDHAWTSFDGIKDEGVQVTDGWQSKRAAEQAQRHVGMILEAIR